MDRGLLERRSHGKIAWTTDICDHLYSAADAFLAILALPVCIVQCPLLASMDVFPPHIKDPETAHVPNERCAQLRAHLTPKLEVAIENARKHLLDQRYFIFEFMIGEEGESSDCRCILSAELRSRFQSLQYSSRNMGSHDTAGSYQYAYVKTDLCDDAGWHDVPAAGISAPMYRIVFQTRADIS